MSTQQQSVTRDRPIRLILLTRAKNKQAHYSIYILCIAVFIYTEERRINSQDLRSERSFVCGFGPNPKKLLFLRTKAATAFSAS